MPNPRFLNFDGSEYQPTVELLKKLEQAHKVYTGNIEFICDKWGFSPRDFLGVQGVYLIGSHATEKHWHDDTSDLDFKLLTPEASPSDLAVYKKEVLDPVLCRGSKRRWIDLFFAQRDDQIMPPRFDLTQFWNEFSQRRD